MDSIIISDDKKRLDMKVIVDSLHHHSCRARKRPAGMMVRVPEAGKKNSGQAGCPAYHETNRFDKERLRYVKCCR